MCVSVSVSACVRACVRVRERPGWSCRRDPAAVWTEPLSEACGPIRQSSALTQACGPDPARSPPAETPSAAETDAAAI